MHDVVCTVRTLFGLIGSPQCEIVSEKLHNQSGVFVALFRESVQLGYGIIECLGVCVRERERERERGGVGVCVC